MDVAYNQHANSSRRKNRSTTNLNHLTLAPLTSKLPLTDDDGLSDFLADPPHTHSISYLEGKSAPTTPGLLSRSPARSNSHSRRSSHPHDSLPKSKSASHLAINGGRNTRGRKAASGTVSPNTRRRRDDPAAQPGTDHSDSDWLLRAGALISSETREFKGQAWLVSRKSSTSLTGVRDADEEAFERELAREREVASRQSSRRGSVANADGELSPRGSRQGSRSASRVGSKAQLFTPLERRSDDGYFPRGDDYIPGPDFVNLDEKLEAIELDTSQDDEATVRRLVKGGNARPGSWLVGWSLFSVEENDDESDDVDGETEGDVDDVRERRDSSARHFEGVSNVPEERIPPPKADDGGWQDAAWLLSVASKVLL